MFSCWWKVGFLNSYNSIYQLTFLFYVNWWCKSSVDAYQTFLVAILNYDFINVYGVYGAYISTKN